MNDNTPSAQIIYRSELRQLVRSQLQALLEQNNLSGAKTLLVPVQPVDIAEAIEGLPESMQAIAFRLLSKDEAIEVYEHLDTSVQQALLQEFRSQEMLDIVGNMSPDDRAKLFDELPAKVVRRLLALLGPSERQATALLLGYGEDSAGRIMTPEYISLKAHLSISQTLEHLRTLATASELIYYLYVTDNSRYLTGIVSLRDLVISPPEKTLGEVMTREVVCVYTDTDREEVGRLIQRYDLLALPVVDKEQRLVGVITVDDVIDVLQEEATEDIYALGGVQADSENYFQTNLLTVARRRVFWLLVLLITNSFTGAIIRDQGKLFETADQAVVLAAFIPLLTGTGGNVGAQSSTVVIRGLRTDEIKDLGPLQVVLREAMAGLLLGTMLGFLATLWAFYWMHENVFVALSVGSSLLVIAILASIAGSGLPFLFRYLKLDPALMSAPFITTAVDILGVFIYFKIARAILRL